MATAAIPPSQSLYIQNLPEKFPKEDLRRELYMLFSTYGSVLDITALKTAKMRGQAHILFRDVQSATQALRSCQGFEVGGREMKISYSKNRSKTLEKLTGTVGQPIASATTEGAARSTGQITAAPPSSFPAPPGTLPAPPGTLPAPPGTLPAPPSGLPPPPGMLPAKVNGGVPAALKAPDKAVEDVASPQGVKRQREESDDENEDDAPMEEEEDDEGGEMDMSDED